MFSNFMFPKFKKKPFEPQTPAPVLILAKRYFKWFLEDNDMSNSLTNITKFGVLFNVNNKTLTINITTYRPGIIIGKGGKMFDAIKAFILEQFKYDFEKDNGQFDIAIVDINLEEEKMWNDVYKYK